MSRIKEFTLPDLGEGLTEGEILAWLVKVGDTIELNQPIVEVETAKAAVEIPAKWAGVVTRIFHDAGTTVEVGAPIISIDTDPGAGPVPSAELAAVEVAPEEGAVEPGMIGGPAPGGRTAVLVGYGPKTAAAKRRPRIVAHGHAAAATPPPAAAAPRSVAQPAPAARLNRPPAPRPGAPRRLGRASAPARAGDASRPAPGACTGSALGGAGRAGRPGAGQAAGAQARPGPRGRPGHDRRHRPAGLDHAGRRTAGGGRTGPTRSSPAARRARAAPAAVFDASREQRIPIKGVRKLTAENMVASAFTAPHVTEFLTVDVTRSMKSLERLKARPEWRDVRVSPLLLVAKAVLLARQAAPDGQLDLVRRRRTRSSSRTTSTSGIAAATERGLIVPNIKDAGRLTLRELADALNALVQTAKSGKTAPSDMSGGTFTITNVGVFGIDTGTPILPPGEAAILAFGAIRPTPWVHKGKIKIRQVTTLGLSFDHRIVDGELGSKFLRDIGAFLTDPEAALLSWT